MVNKETVQGNYARDVEGLAIASIFAQFLSCGHLFLVICRKCQIIRIERERLKLNPNTITIGLSLGVPVALQQGILPMGSVLSKRAINYFGTAAIAGLTAAYQIDEMAMISICNMSAAITTFTAQNRSAGKPERVRKGFLTGAGLAISISISLGIGLIFLFFSGQLVALFSIAEETAWYAQKLLMTFSSVKSLGGQ